jgi:hypothetical protein
MLYTGLQLRWQESYAGGHYEPNPIDMNWGDVWVDEGSIWQQSGLYMHEFVVGMLWFLLMLGIIDIGVLIYVALGL